MELDTAGDPTVNVEPGKNYLAATPHCRLILAASILRNMRLVCQDQREERNHLKRTKFTELSLKGVVTLTASVGTGDQLEHVCTHHIQHASGR